MLLNLSSLLFGSQCVLKGFFSHFSLPAPGKGKAYGVENMGCIFKFAELEQVLMPVQRMIENVMVEGRALG